MWDVGVDLLLFLLPRSSFIYCYAALEFFFLFVRSVRHLWIFPPGFRIFGGRMRTVDGGTERKPADRREEVGATATNRTKPIIANNNHSKP